MVRKKTNSRQWHEMGATDSRASCATPLWVCPQLSKPGILASVRCLFALFRVNKCNGDFATATLLLWSSENNWNASPPGLSDTYFVANSRRGFGCQQGFIAYEGDFSVGAVDGLCRSVERKIQFAFADYSYPFTLL